MNIKFKIQIQSNPIQSNPIQFRIYSNLLNFFCHTGHFGVNEVFEFTTPAVFLEKQS